MPQRIELAIASVNFTLGLWLVVSAFLYAPTTGLHWSNAISGIAVCALATYDIQRGREGVPSNQYTASVISLLGSLVIAYSLLSLPRSTLMWSNLFVGTGLFALSWFSISQSRNIAEIQASN